MRITRTTVSMIRFLLLTTNSVAIDICVHYARPLRRRMSNCRLSELIGIRSNARLFRDNWSGGIEFATVL